MHVTYILIVSSFSSYLFKSDTLYVFHVAYEIHYDTATTRELGKATRADKPTETVEACEIERVEERERGVKPGETEAKN